MYFWLDVSMMSFGIKEDFFLRKLDRDLNGGRNLFFIILLKCFLSSWE